MPRAIAVGVLLRAEAMKASEDQNFSLVESSDPIAEFAKRGGYF